LVGLLCIKPEKFDYCEIGYYVVPDERRKEKILRPRLFPT